MHFNLLYQNIYQFYNLKKHGKILPNSFIIEL